VAPDAAAAGAGAADAAPAVPTPDEQLGGAEQPAAPAEQSAAPAEQPAAAEPQAAEPSGAAATEPQAAEPSGAAAPMSPLAEAEATEATLRAQLGELVSARVRAEAEASRLADRAPLAGADPSLRDLSARYRDQAGRLAAEVEELRGQLRAHEARAEALRADAQGV
jgi:hypothetical protein